MFFKTDIKSKPIYPQKKTQLEKQGKYCCHFQNLDMGIDDIINKVVMISTTFITLKK